ncbi:hypothetical protein H8B02_18140 [Bradyrhizobium sp. Pear77]|uniref:hypothetical protein n=1 Tax=Bradyrhizobium altum TaxID=1571202 RepID=UPI001E6251B0|nr:hypothetical protein [Bradyrhizobium altum]MCC8955288.1 hypothetical protein [Bradyrhizobium altum]
MTRARSFRTNDTTPPPGAILRAGESMTVVAAGANGPNWTKPDAYLPNSNLTTIAAFGYGTFNTPKNCVVQYTPIDVDHFLPVHGLTSDNLLLGQACLFQGPDNDQVLLWHGEMNKAASGHFFSIICNSVIVSEIPKPAMLFYGGPAQANTPLQGYEEFHSANWDGQEAEAITPQTLAYARKLMKILPTTLGKPDAAPAGDGSIALEWVPEDLNHKLDRLFLDIGPGEQWRAYWSLRNGEFDRVTHEGFSDRTEETLQKIFQQLSS